MLGNQIAGDGRCRSTRLRRQLQREEHRGAGARTSTRRSRWNWGVVGGQVPYLSGGVHARARTRSAASRHTIEETIIFRQTERSAAGVVAYPFNRAQRVEFQGGVSQISFDQIVDTAGVLAEHRAADRPTTRRTTSLGETADARHLVGGARVRHLDLRRDQPGAGPALSVRGVADLRRRSSSRACSADYRRYFMPVPFYTLADARHALRPLRQRRRGRAAVPAVTSAIRSSCAATTSNTFDASECRADGVERLPGVRSADGQPHAGRQPRVPLPAAAPVRRVAGHVRPGAGRSGALRRRRRGVEPAASRRAVRRRRREAVASVGVAFRVNLLGFAVGEFDVAHPLQRPAARAGSSSSTSSPGF